MPPAFWEKNFVGLPTILSSDKMNEHIFYQLPPIVSYSSLIC